MKARFIWRALRARFRDQTTELKAIRKAVRPGDTVCDIGANKGSYLLWLARWVRPGRVIAFEPQEPLARYLTEVCARLRLNNITVEAKAVHSTTGQLTLHVPGSGDSPGASLSARVATRETCRGVSVPVVSLDDYLKAEGRVSCLKVDVEGSELNVFKGAEVILRRHSPLLVFECEIRHLESGSVFDVFAFLTGLGYSGEFVCGRRLCPIAEFRPEVHQKQAGERFWDAKDYCNNFVFRKNS
ncbi:MAG: FkbM family methyltransferase [Verrucomicrobiota bacterium]